MKKGAQPKTAKNNGLTWGNCLFVGMEWEKCDVNGNGIYNAIFLAHGETMQKFKFWGYSTARNALEYMKPLTPCTLTFHWYRNWKWLETVEIEGGQNDN